MDSIPVGAGPTLCVVVKSPSSDTLHGSSSLVQPSPHMKVVRHYLYYVRKYLDVDVHVYIDRSWKVVSNLHFSRYTPYTPRNREYLVRTVRTPYSVLNTTPLNSRGVIDKISLTPDPKYVLRNSVPPFLRSSASHPRTPHACVPTTPNGAKFDRHDIEFQQKGLVGYRLHQHTNTILGHDFTKKLGTVTMIKRFSGIRVMLQAIDKRNIDRLRYAINTYGFL